jgi:hypothetical protein
MLEIKRPLHCILRDLCLSSSVVYTFLQLVAGYGSGGLVIIGLVLCKQV